MKEKRLPVTFAPLAWSTHPFISMRSLWVRGSKPRSRFSPCRLWRVFFWSSSPTGTSSCRMLGMLILSASLCSRHSSE